MEQNIEQELKQGIAQKLFVAGGRASGKRSRHAQYMQQAAKRAGLTVTDSNGSAMQSFAADNYFVPRISPLAWAIHITSQNLWRQHL